MEQSREYALLHGLPRYASLKPCPQGHVGERYTKDYKCVACRKHAASLWIQENKDKHAAYAKKCSEANKEAYAVVRKNRYERTKERTLQQQKEYRLKNADAIRERNKRYQSENKEVGAAKTARYRAAQAQRTPTWLTEEDHWMIQQAYEIAATRTKVFGFTWDVDHVIPLRGKIVSGLHTPQNLRVIPASLNRRKRNRYELGTA